MIESGNLSLPNESDDSVDEVSEAGEEEGNMDSAKLSVTQFDDPLSGGHFAGGASKAPPGSARERSRVVVHGIGALHMGHRKHARSHVGRESPISNGLTTVGGANTRLLFDGIYHNKIRHGVPTCSSLGCTENQ